MTKNSTRWLLDEDSKGPSASSVKKWTDAEEEYLKSNFSYEKLDKISKTLKRSRNSVLNKAVRMALYNPKRLNNTKHHTFERVSKSTQTYKEATNPIVQSITKDNTDYAEPARVVKKTIFRSERNESGIYKWILLFAGLNLALVYIAILINLIK